MPSDELLLLENSSLKYVHLNFECSNNQKVYSNCLKTNTMSKSCEIMRKPNIMLNICHSIPIIIWDIKTSIFVYHNQSIKD